MSLLRYLLHDFWTAREFNRRDEEQEARRQAKRLQDRRRRRSLNALEERIAELESDLQDAGCLLRAVAQHGIDKGLFDRDEIAAAVRRLREVPGGVEARPGFDPPAQVD